MSRASAWQPCNRLLEERWRESEHQQHRARLESIHGTNALAGRATATLTASGSSGTIHSSRTGDSSHTARGNSNCSAGALSAATKTVKLVSRSKSPAAKSRQKQIDRENLILIKKIIALDNVHSSKANSNAAPAKQHRKGNKPAKVTPTQLSNKKDCQTQSANRNTVVIPERSANWHDCKPPLPGVASTSCHPLYTHHSATMANNFADLNGSTLTFSKTWDRDRAQLKIQDENKRLLQRILSARKSYSRTQWSEQAKERRKLLRNISRHHGSSSTGRLPPHYCGDGGIGDEQVSTCDGRARRRHNSSSDEFISTAAKAIRLLHTTHLRSTQQEQQKQQQRPLSASAAPGRSVLTSTWAAGESANRLSVSSCRKPVSESIVQRMRSMTIDKREYENEHDDSEEEGEYQDQDPSEDADYGIAQGEDEDEDDDDGVEALLRDLD